MFGDESSVQMSSKPLTFFLSFRTNEEKGKLTFTKCCKIPRT